MAGSWKATGFSPTKAYVIFIRTKTSYHCRVSTTTDSLGKFTFS